MGSEFGYAYRHEFLMGDVRTARCLLPPPEERVKSNFKYHIFELRTKFLVEDEHGTTVGVLGSERFHACCSPKDGVRGRHHGRLIWATGSRLCEEYWMTFDEVYKLCESAMDFATEIENHHPDLDVIPVVVEIKVCTVQQAGEGIAATFDRAIGPDRLLPLYMCLVLCSYPYPVGFKVYLDALPKIRVKTLEQGLGLMDVCGICSRGPNIGDRITHLDCKHAFHSHCAVKWLMGSELCPSCNPQQHVSLPAKTSAHAEGGQASPAYEELVSPMVVYV